MSNLSLIKFAYNWEYPHLLLDVVYRDYPLCEIESGLIHGIICVQVSPDNDVYGSYGLSPGLKR